MKWIVKFILNYFNFEGRASRKENVIIMSFVLFVILSGFAIDTMLEADYVIAIICVLSVIVPSYSVSVRRLHDLGYSGAHVFRRNIFLSIEMLTKEGEGPNRYGEPPID